MPYTPVELRHVKLGRSLLGFSRSETERVLGEVADSFEDVWRERGELTDRVEDLEKRLEDVQQREQLLAQTLVSAEKAATEAKDAAKREAELIVAEAHGEARSIMRAAQSERERLFAEARRVEAVLRAALGIVAETGAESAAATAGAEGEAQQGEQQPGPPAAPPVEHWPNREDTREFGIVRGDAAAERPAQPELPPQPIPGQQQLEPPQAAAREFAWGD